MVRDAKKMMRTKFVPNLMSFPKNTFLENLLVENFSGSRKFAEKPQKLIDRTRGKIFFFCLKCSLKPYKHFVDYENLGSFRDHRN